GFPGIDVPDTTSALPGYPYQPVPSRHPPARAAAPGQPCGGSFRPARVSKQPSVDLLERVRRPGADDDEDGDDKERKHAVCGGVPHITLTLLVDQLVSERGERIGHTIARTRGCLGISIGEEDDYARIV